MSTHNKDIILLLLLNIFLSMVSKYLWFIYFLKFSGDCPSYGLAQDETDRKRFMEYRIISIYISCYKNNANIKKC